MRPWTVTQSADDLLGRLPPRNRCCRTHRVLEGRRREARQLVSSSLIGDRREDETSQPPGGAGVEHHLHTRSWRRDQDSTTFGAQTFESQEEELQQVVERGVPQTWFARARAMTPVEGLPVARGGEDWSGCRLALEDEPRARSGRDRTGTSATRRSPAAWRKKDAEARDVGAPRRPRGCAPAQATYGRRCRSALQGSTPSRIRRAVAAATRRWGSRRPCRRSRRSGPWRFCWV